MLSLSSLVSLVSRLFSAPVAAPVEAPESLSQFIKELADDAAAAPVAVVAPVVASLPIFNYKVIAPTGSCVLLARSVEAANEADALRKIGAFEAERIQIVGGGRYRVCVTNGGKYVYRPIELIDRSGSGARSNHTKNRTESSAVVGQPTLPYYSDTLV